MPAPRLLAFAFLFVLALAAPSQSQATDTRNPVGVVENFHATLLESMKNAEELGYPGRFGKLAPAVDRAFDLARMIRVASGGHWRKAEESKRQALVAAFRRMSIANYAAQFDGYGGERFETDGTRPGPRDTLLVRTRLADGPETVARFTYVMVETDDGWRIGDVLLDDTISQLAVRRSEYRRILETNGIEGLIAELDAKADDLETP